MELLTPREILDKTEYEKGRPEMRRRMMVIKEKRRVLVGDHCVVHFENRDTMLYQVHEMLRAEDSWNREGAVGQEIEAYNPIIPQKNELSATLMFEHETPEERAVYLPRLAGIDRYVFLHVGTAPWLLAEFDRGQIDERKVSSVQYIKWRLPEGNVDLLQTEGTVLRLVINHPAYQAQAVLSESTRSEIMNDPA
jgi:hypothetical protein